MMQDTMVLEFPMDHNLVASHEKKADRENDRIMHFGMQRKIVSHMTSESWKTIPHVTYMYEPDVTDFMQEYRALSHDASRRHKITVNTIMLKAIAEGLKAAPALNAHIDYRERTVRGSVTVLDHIDISVPWCLPNGEMIAGCRFEIAR